jgi:protein TonB
MKKNIYLFCFILMSLFSFSQVKKKVLSNKKEPKIEVREIKSEDAINDNNAPLSVEKVPSKFERIPKISEENVAVPEISSSDNDNLIYNSAGVEVYPQFPGGMEKFYQFLGDNFKIAQEILDKKTNGKVFVTFVIEKDGKLSDIKVIRDIGFGTKEEAIRVMQICPNWIPAELNGKKVRCQYSIPITIDGTK